jgi:hypothetical protein
VHWTYGQATTNHIGPINLLLMHFLIEWMYRGIDHWFRKAARAAIPLSRLALQVCYEAVTARRRMVKASLTHRLSALTAAVGCP